MSCPPRDPVLNILIDAVAIDDDFGRRHHLVVQGDELSQEQVRAALRKRGVSLGWYAPSTTWMQVRWSRSSKVLLWKEAPGNDRAAGAAPS